MHSLTTQAFLRFDSDGVPDGLDAFPNNETEWQDSDSDGYGDNSDDSQMMR